MNLAFNLYVVLRCVTFCFALTLGFLLLAAFVWVPFYASEGYTIQFQDRIHGLIGELLLFVTIVIPYRWTVASPYYQFRQALLVLTAAWVCVVDLKAYELGLTNQLISLSSILTIVVGGLVYVTLTMYRNRLKRAPE
jgi:hypothetical protein